MGCVRVSLLFIPKMNMWICLHTNGSLYVGIYICMFVCTYVCMYVCMYVRMYVCMYVCMYGMYICMYVCMYVLGYVYGLVFLLCGSLHNYESIRAAAVGEKLVCWTEGFSTADVDFDNFGVSLTGLFTFCKVAGWLVTLYSDHFQGRQTVENHLVHTGTSLYRRTHIMMSSISFMVFIFTEAGQSAKLFLYMVPDSYTPEDIRTL